MFTDSKIENININDIKIDRLDIIKNQSVDNKINNIKVRDIVNNKIKAIESNRKKDISLYDGGVIKVI